MYRIVFVLFLMLACPLTATANIADYKHYFDVKMDMDLSDLKTYILKMKELAKVYDKGYVYRSKIDKKFKTEFSRTIKNYGLSENRIKSYYEDDLLDMIKMMPKEYYQYIGPMLHEVPGMSEKILNLPGIKETKNKFPEKIADKYKGLENIEFLSPALYVALMPDLWERKPEDLDTPEEVKIERPKKPVHLPDYLNGKIEMPQPQAENLKSSAKVKVAKKPVDHSIRTLYPTLTSPLTTKDAEAFLATLDSINAWGEANNNRNSLAIIRANVLLDFMEKEKQAPLTQTNLKDMVNPCQNLVLKTRIAGNYSSFRTIVAKEGFSPEEWAYTCDKTIKAFRVVEANHALAQAIQFHRRGYYHKYIEMLPEKWQVPMYESEAALVAMYTVLKEDVEAVRPIRNKIFEKFNQNDARLITTPIIY